MAYNRLKDMCFDKYVGNRVEFIALLVSAETKTSKAGTSYGDLNISDGGKKYNIKWFKCSQSEIEALESGKVYRFMASVSTYKNAISLIADEVELVSADGSAFLDIDTRAKMAMDIINKRVHELDGYVLHKLVMSLLNNNYEAFTSYGGGSSNHHAAIGGLLVHSACVCETAVSIAELYNKLYGQDLVNLDMVKCGALLHDIGKVNELVLNKATGHSEYTALSALESHSIFGIEMITREAERLGLSEEPAVKELIHIIASHHMAVDSGALMNPHTVEAQIVAYSDGLDATMDRYSREYSELKPGEISKYWRNGIVELYYKPTNASRRLKI